MTKRFALLLTLVAAAVTLLGFTGCTKSKMMGSLDHPAQQQVQHIG